MRILRGKSNLEVSSQGFAWFVVGLVLATFLGGAVRTILSSERVHSRIVSELKNRFPRHEFQIGQTEVLLSRGLWPGLGLRLRHVTFKQDVCGKLSFLLDIPQMSLPVDMLNLRHGRLRLGSVEMAGGKLRLDYKECPAEKGGGTSRSTAQGLRSTVAEKGIQPPRLEWSDLAANLRGLELRDFEVVYERNLTWKLIFKEAELGFSDDMSLQATVDVQKSLPFGTLSHLVEFEGQAEKQVMHWSVQSEFKEGLVKWSGSWDLAANTAMTRMQALQIPLKDLSSELFQMGFIRQDVKLKTAWLTCQIGWEGEMANPAAMPLRARDCKIEGAYGRIDVEQADVFPAEDPPLKVPALVHVQKLQLQPLAESLGRQVLPAVVSRLGLWSGVLRFSGPSSWDLEGMLENMEVVFSNQSVRGKQAISRLHTQARRSHGGIEGRVDAVEFQDGEFAGAIEVNLNADGRSGGFTVQVGRLGFSPAIQSILIGGKMTPLKITGRGNLSDGELTDWNGQFALSELSGEGWTASGLDVKSRFADGVFKIDARAARAAVDTRWRYHQQLRIADPGISESIAWRDLSARFEIAKNGGSLLGLSAAEVEQGASWRARASWVRDGELTGSLAVRQRDFALRGERGNLVVQDKQAAESL